MGLAKALKRVADVDYMVPESQADVELVVGNPEQLHWNSERALRVGFTTWESRNFPQSKVGEITKRLGMADLIVVSSEAAAVAFRELAMNTPVEVVLLGYDPEEFYPVTRKRKRTTRFLLAGVAQPRKGSWLALEAFVRAFRYRSGVRLTVWSTAKQPMLEQLKTEYAGNKLIRFDEMKVDSARIVLERHDVLLSPHLAEGFGLHIVEAMATGMPCIVSRCSAPLEFFDDRCGYWVEMTDNYIPVNISGEPDIAGYWRLPNVDSLAEKMRLAVKRKADARRKGAFAATYAAQNYTWNHSADKLMSVLRRYCEFS